MARNDSLGFFWEDVAKVRERKEAPPKRQPPERVWERPGYCTGLERALSYYAQPLTLQELIQTPGDELLYDVEIYPNFFCVTFESLKTGKSLYFELSEWCPQLDTQLLHYIYTNFVCVGFNNLNYDYVMMSMVLQGKTLAEMWQATQDIIVFEQRPRDVLRKFKCKRIAANEWDLIEVAPLRASLKIYGGRLHTPEMQDLPFAPGTVLTYDQSRVVKYYNHKDLVNTRFLRLGLEPQVALRIEMSQSYGLDLRSRSDAQIAESVITEEVQKILGYRPKQPEIKPGTIYKFTDPGFLKFRTNLMKRVMGEVMAADFVVEDHGSIGMPQQLADLEVKIAGGVYRMGIGGLHSSESKVSYVAGGEYRLLDRDVTSFYPYIILNQGLYPDHLGIHFLTVYRAIVERRVQAKENAKACKKAGDKTGEAHWKNIAESLKIVVNGSYGKLGSKYSVLYAPRLLIQTTLTGQLSLLMMIERMELAGITCVSANTDGVVMKVPTHLQATYEAIIEEWERDTNFETEETEYSALYSRDVNNYIAVKPPTKEEPNHTVKTKGAFANPWSNNKQIEPWMHKNPVNTICVEAITELLTKRIPIEKTIRECKKFSKFVNVRTVKGGAVVTTKPDRKNRTATERMMLVQASGYEQLKSDIRLWYNPTYEAEFEARPMEEVYESLLAADFVEYLGKAVRFYYAKDRETYDVIYAKNGNKVPRSEGSKPCMDLPKEMPDDIDYDWYIRETESLLKQLAYA